MARLDKFIDAEIDLRKFRHYGVSYVCELQKRRNERAVEKVKSAIQDYLNRNYIDEKTEVPKLPFKRD
jgi:hypothetical protein